MLGLKMFASELKLLALGLGVLIVPLPLVAADLQILESAFEQLEFILGLLAFLFPLVAARLEEGHQFPQGTSELEMRHDFQYLRDFVIAPQQTTMEQNQAFGRTPIQGKITGTEHATPDLIERPLVTVKKSGRSCTTNLSA